MLTRLMVTLTVVAFVGAPSAFAECNYGHKTSAQTADATTATQESATPAASAALPQPADTVTVAEAPKNETAQD